MTCARSTASSPSFCESASRSDVSETKPSCTSSRPTGRRDFACSTSAIRNWSSLRMPWSIRIWPMWRLACWVEGAFIARASARELLHALARALQCEVRRARGRELERAAVVLERGRGLMQLIEAHRQVEREIRIPGVRGLRFGIGKSRLVPAPLPGVLVAEREVQHARFRVRSEHGLDPAFGLHRVDALGTQR